DLWLLIQQLFVTTRVGSTITKIAAHTLLPDGASELQKEMHEGNRRADIQACAGADSNALKPEELKDYLTIFGQTLIQQLRLSEIIRRRWILLRANGFEDTVLPDEPRDEDMEEASEQQPLLAEPQARLRQDLLQPADIVHHLPAANNNHAESDVRSILPANNNTEFSWSSLADTLILNCDGDIRTMPFPEAIGDANKLVISKTTWCFRPEVLFALQNYFGQARWNSEHTVSILEIFVDFVYATGVIPQYRKQRLTTIAAYFQAFLSAMKVASTHWGLKHLCPDGTVSLRVSELAPLGLTRQCLTLSLRPALRCPDSVRNFSVWLAQLTCAGDRLNCSFMFDTRPFPVEWKQLFDFAGNELRVRLGLPPCLKAHIADHKRIDTIALNNARVTNLLAKGHILDIVVQNPGNHLGLSVVQLWLKQAKLRCLKCDKLYHIQQLKSLCTQVRNHV
ncbi:unnamed protein product, partial [Polarella glacialis]